ncbi:hypothetical protein FRC07_010718, partial [Ceratobasidium sp. 392]
MTSTSLEHDISVDPPHTITKTEGHDMSNVEEEFDELKEEKADSATGGYSSEEDPQLPTTKRTRKAQRASRPRKRYVRGKQGSLKGLMQMPIDIVTEIMNLLSPGDLISLARSSKFFRNLLLRRSNIQTWRRAESNVPGLPPCPPGMCEPQYALMFSKHCTFCGASATAKPDPYLWARLCITCRENDLMDIEPWDSPSIVDSTLVNSSSSINFKVDKTRPRGTRHPLCSLKQEVNEVLDKEKEFQDASDHTELANWEQERRVAVNARRKVGLTIAHYLDSVDKSSGRELGHVKQQRRRTIYERLKALGWTNEDLSLCSDDKPWRAIVEASKPLTDRIWTNILPKLTQLREDNRERHIVQAAEARRSRRRKHIDKFLKEMQRTEHPLEPILEALGVHDPPSPESDNPLDPFGGLGNRKFEFGNTFPNTSYALTWDCLADLCERELTVEEVEAELQERETQIAQTIMEWRTSLEQRLAEIFEGGDHREGNEDVVLTVGGSTELTDHLSRDLRLLLRADTVFTKPHPPESGLSGWHRHWDPSYYYPNLISSVQEDFGGLASFFNPQPNLDQDFDVSEYGRHNEIEKLIKRLLRDLGMPDATRIELCALKSRFVCGRCAEKYPRSWDDLIEHYLSEKKAWNTRSYPREPSFPLRHPPMLRNVHDIEVQDNPKPLAEVVTQDE